MAYVDIRPQPCSSDCRHGMYRKGSPRRWNPEQQEVIVIDDSPPPVSERPRHHEPPSNNTRGAVSKRRRLPEPHVAPYRTAAISGYHALQETPLIPQPANYEIYPPTGLYRLPAQVMSTFQQGAVPNQFQYSYGGPASDYRSSYGSPYLTPHIPHVVAAPTKRKRLEYDDGLHNRMQTRNSNYTIENSTNSKTSRIHKKNREVVLRRELDLLPNFSGKPYDDVDGHYAVEQEAELTPRYQIDRLLGQGTFGKVVSAYDRQTSTWVAIKVIRAIQKYRDASMIELRVLRTLHENDPHNANNCIHLQDCFDYRNHVCIVTELLDQSIFDFLKGNNFAPFPNRQIQHFAKQLLTSVAFLHELDLIHTDLKPENILLVSREAYAEPWQGRNNVRTRKVLRNSELRLIDFGSATFQDEYHSNVVSTRHYRAPEIILGMGWSFPCDIWSIGCILIEFYTGDALFQTHDNLEHLAMMEVVCGRIDGRIIRSCSKLAQKMFRPSGRLDYPNRETSKDSKKFVKQMKSLGEMFPPVSVFNNTFCDLLSKIFTYDPDRRITAKGALKHPFFST